MQQDQLAPPEVAEALALRVFALPDIEERPIFRASPPERGLWLRENVPSGPSDAFINDREIGHFHPWDRSMHISLPPDVAQRAVAAAWAQVHPVAKFGLVPEHYVMIYAPRDANEADVVFGLGVSAYRRAGGRVPPA